MTHEMRLSVGDEWVAICQTYEFLDCIVTLEIEGEGTKTFHPSETFTTMQARKIKVISVERP